MLAKDDVRVVTWAHKKCSNSPPRKDQTGKKSFLEKGTPCPVFCTSRRQKSDNPFIKFCQWRWVKRLFCRFLAKNERKDDEQKAGRGPCTNQRGDLAQLSRRAAFSSPSFLYPSARKPPIVQFSPREKSHLNILLTSSFEKKSRQKERKKKPSLSDLGMDSRQSSLENPLVDDSFEKPNYDEGGKMHRLGHGKVPRPTNQCISYPLSSTAFFFFF